MQAPAGQRINALNGTVAEHQDGRSYIAALGATLTDDKTLGPVGGEGTSGWNDLPEADDYGQLTGFWSSAVRPSTPSRLSTAPEGARSTAARAGTRSISRSTARSSR